MDNTKTIFLKAIEAIGIIAGIIIAFKLSIFYMPFVIAFILYLMIEPIVKFFMNTFKLKRKTSSIIILTIILAIIVGLVIVAIATIVTEASHLLENLNEYVGIVENFVHEGSSGMNRFLLKCPSEIQGIVNSSISSMIDYGSKFVQQFFSNLLNVLTSIPNVMIYIFITIMSVYFMSTDKIYMLDQLEHHLPKGWVNKMTVHLKNIVKSLGGYLKAQLILILITFFICLVRIVYFLLC